MAFSLLPGENVRLEITAADKGKGLFFTPSTSLRVTNFRLVATESLTRGSDVTKYMPLEHIVYMQEGRYSSNRLRNAAILLVVLGIIATLTLIGAIIGIPLIVAGVICTILYFLRRTQSLIVQSGGEDIVLSLRGGGEETERVIREIELARMERTGGNYGPAAQGGAASTLPANVLAGTLPSSTTP